jgi:hypothetical protein
VHRRIDASRFIAGRIPARRAIFDGGIADPPRVSGSTAAAASDAAGGKERSDSELACGGAHEGAKAALVAAVSFASVAVGQIRAPLVVVASRDWGEARRQ